MPIREIKRSAMLVAVTLMAAGPVSAFDFGNMMNPGEWFGGNDDYYDDYYGPGPGWGGYPPPYGGPGYGAPGFAGPGYGGPGFAGPGYGAPGFAGPGGPGYGAPAYGAPGAGMGAPAVTPPETGSDTESLEIEQLKRRIRELEEEKRQSAAPAGQPAYQAPAGAYGSGQSYPPPGSNYGEPGYGGQKGPGYSHPSGGQANRWYYREDAGLPPVADQ
jgi:hypothetical protein